MPKGPPERSRSRQPTTHKTGPVEVNPELSAIIKSNSRRAKELPLAQHIESIEARKAAELAAFLRVAGIRLQSDALF